MNEAQLLEVVEFQLLPIYDEQDGDSNKITPFGPFLPTWALTVIVSTVVSPGAGKSGSGTLAVPATKSRELAPFAPTVPTRIIAPMAAENTAAVNTFTLSTSHDGVTSFA